MTRRQVSEQSAQQRTDVAAMDAYARRVAGAPALPDDDAFADEIAQFVQLHERVASLPQPDVAPSVRAVVLGAAAQVAQQRGVRPSGAVWQRWLAWCMRPGPVLALTTVAGLVVALRVRQEVTHVHPSDAAVAREVAMVDTRAPEVGVAPAPVAVAPADAPPAAAPPALAEAAPGPAAAARPDSDPVAPPVAAPSAKHEREAAPVADSPAPAPAPAAAAAMERPARTIEAQAASLGPVDDLAVGTGTRNGPAEQVAEADDKRALAKVDVGQAGRAANESAKTPAAYRAAATKDETTDHVVAAREEKAQAVGNVANVANTPKNVALSNQGAAQNVAQNVVPNVVQLQNQVKNVQSDAEREALLEKLVAAAHDAGDRKAEAAAQLALQSLRAKRAEANQNLAKKRAENLQASPPVQRAKNAPAQSSDELKAATPQK